MCAVAQASSATGMSVVPAQTTATRPSRGGVPAAAGAVKVRETGSYRPCGAAASAAASASGAIRVTSTACPSDTSLWTRAPICSGRLRSPKITSGTPMRSARSPSSWAKSAICCTGSSPRRRAASSTETSPALTCSRNLSSARASIAGDLSHDAEHREKARERFVHRRRDDAAGVPDAGEPKIRHQEQRRVEVAERRLYRVREAAVAYVRDRRHQGEPDRRRHAAHVARDDDVRHLRQRAGVQRRLLGRAAGRPEQEAAHQRRSLLADVHHPTQARAALDLEMDGEGGAVRLQHAPATALWPDLCPRLGRLDEGAQEPSQRTRGVRRAELRKLAQRLHLLWSQLERAEGAAVHRHAAPRSRCAVSASSWRPRGSRTSSGRPLPRTVVPARPRTRSSGGKSGLRTASSCPTSRSTESAKVMPSTSRTANGLGPGGASEGSPKSLARE